MDALSRQAREAIGILERVQAAAFFANRLIRAFGIAKSDPGALGFTQKIGVAFRCDHFVGFVQKCVDPLIVEVSAEVHRGLRNVASPPPVVAIDVVGFRRAF
ncbi:MAG TPA: hypothetical protein VKT24_05425 [Rhizomicrobium sp.]|nr:hypothetical protein [Rhizomicrobium sp.]